jgi:luciferase family oxidoreductase group 1
MKISILDQTHLLEGRSAEDGLQETVELAQYLDEIGYHRYWLSEHHSTEALAGSSPEILASYLLAKTNRIKLGSGGVMLPHYSSYKVAENFKVMGGLAPGRVDLGVGRAPGGHQLSTIALQSERTRHGNVDRFPQQVDEVLEYLEDELPETHPLQGLEASPAIKEKPPLWILGTSNTSAYLAAGKGLPYSFAHFINNQPGGMKEAIEYYVRNFKPSKYLDKPKVMVSMKIIVADTDEEAERIAQTSLRVDYYLRRGQITRLIDPDKAFSNDLSSMDKMEINNYKRNYIIGSKETVAETLKQLSETLPIDEIMAVAQIYDLEDRKKSFKLLKEVVDEIE